MKQRLFYLTGAMAAVVALVTGFVVTGAVLWLLVGFFSLLTLILLTILRGGRSE